MTETSAALRADRTRPVFLRFMLGPEAIESFAAKIESQGGAVAATEAIDTILLDTQDHAFTASGIGFGIRRKTKAGRWRGWRSFAALYAQGSAKAARRSVRDALRSATAIEVLARIRTQRQIFMLRFGECIGKVRLDTSAVEADGRTIAIASAVFVCAAPNADFLRFLAECSDAQSMRLTAETDLRRIARLSLPSAPHYATAFAPRLDAEMDAGAAFRAIAWACFAQFLLNEADIRESGDREAVHQCRVALRRLSACLRFFRPFVESPECTVLRQKFKDLGAHLREARDLDVLIAEVLAPMLAQDPPEGGTALQREIEARRDKAYGELVGVLETRAAADFFLRFALWLHEGDWAFATERRAVRRRAMPIAKYARRRFASSNEKFLGRCAELAHMAPEERHRVRISAKNMRYDAEFFETLAQGKAGANRLRAFIDAMKCLQTVLGEWNDLLMARHFFESIAVENWGKLSPKSGHETKPKGAGKRPSAAAAAALGARIHAMAETEFAERSAKACQMLLEIKPFWTKLA